MRKYWITAIITALVAIVGLHAWATSSQLEKNAGGGPGVIRGRVIDPEGEPVWGARIHIRKVGGEEFGRIIYYPTDGNGNFSIKGVAPGEYKVFVVKEEGRHPDTDILFYSNRDVRVPKVVVSQTQGTPFVTVQTGRRSALITGHVLNAVNGQPIPDATITFRRPEDYRMTLITSLNQPERPGGYSFLLPSAPLTIQVTAPGYQTWNYRNPAATKQANLLTAAPGETIQMDVKMKPLRR